MPRIAGINIPENKHIDRSLTYIHGIGLALSKEILAKTKIDTSRKASDLSAVEISSLKEIIEKELRVEGDLRRSVMMDIKRLRDIGCWRGLRHVKRLPSRGQRTKRNTRTVRGNVRKTVGSGRKNPAKAT
ncbi:MAG: 30S ribosomal protein S13 [bacterium]